MKIKLPITYYTAKKSMKHSRITTTTLTITPTTLPVTRALALDLLNVVKV